MLGIHAEQWANLPVQPRSHQRRSLHSLSAQNQNTCLCECSGWWPSTRKCEKHVPGKSNWFVWSFKLTTTSLNTKMERFVLTGLKPQQISAWLTKLLNFMSTKFRLITDESVNLSYLKRKFCEGGLLRRAAICDWWPAPLNCYRQGTK